jgi:hypothetical protein
MKNVLDSEQLVRLHGLDGVIFFPQPSGEVFEPDTARFLGSVGLPVNRLYAVRADDAVDEADPVELGALFELEGDECPAERRHWQTLGYLRTTLIVVDPATGAVYGYPEGEEDCIPLHRDVESLAFCLSELRKLQDSSAQGGGREEIAHRFRQAVTAFDPTPLQHEESEWNTILEEFLDGMW